MALRFESLLQKPAAMLLLLFDYHYFGVPSMKLETLAIHGGFKQDLTTNAVAVPIYRQRPVTTTLNMAQTCST